MRRRRLRLCADSINSRTQEKKRKYVRELRLRTVRYGTIYCTAAATALPRLAQCRVVPCGIVCCHAASLPRNAVTVIASHHEAGVSRR
jgi:hypothetical protein